MTAVNARAGQDKSLNFDPNTDLGLEKLGRVRLSKSFHMREFLYSEIAVKNQLRNVPAKGEQMQSAIAAGRDLCALLLEPLQDTFGRIHVRSGYRSREVNAAGVGKGCAADNDGFHTWGSSNGPSGLGATACISIPSVSKQVFEQGSDPYAIAWWIEDHLPDWSFLEFFSTPAFSDELCFNIGWHQSPMKKMSTWREAPLHLQERMPTADQRRAAWQALIKGCR